MRRSPASACRVTRRANWSIRSGSGRCSPSIRWTNSKRRNSCGTPPSRPRRRALPFGAFLRRNGWSDEQIAEYEDSPERQGRVAGLQAAAMGLQAFGGETGGAVPMAEAEEDEEVDSEFA